MRSGSRNLTPLVSAPNASVRGLVAATKLAGTAPSTENVTVTWPPRDPADTSKGPDAPRTSPHNNTARKAATAMAVKRTIQLLLLTIRRRSKQPTGPAPGSPPNEEGGNPETGREQEWQR
jgi:hypothetical protein